MLKFFLLVFFSSSVIFSKPANPNLTFSKIEESYRALLDAPEKNKLRHNYIRHIRNFSTFNQIYNNRQNPKREHANFYIASIYTDLAFVSYRNSDFIIAFRRISNFIDTTYSTDLKKRAIYIREKIIAYAKTKNITQIIDESKNEKDFGDSLTSSITSINEINHFANSITIHTDKKASYFLKTKLLPKSKLFIIEVQNSNLTSRNIRKINSASRIRNVRIYQHTPKLVRIEFETDKNLLPLVTETSEGKKINFAARTSDVFQKARAELNRKYKILVDAGHGGKDPGTIKNGIMEKNLTLSISKLLGNQLRKEGFTVFFTREKDITLSLNERVEIARKIEPDIFLSIHANASKNSIAEGVETYYFDVKSDKTTKEIVTRENTGLGRISDLDFILQDLTLSKNFIDAGSLASKIHNSIISGISKETKRKITNRGTRGGPFFVLYNTNTPSILIEIGFISNPKEAEKLKNKRYQALISRQIVSGIKKYLALSY